MNLRLSIWKATQESVLCEQFLKWQKIGFDRHFGIETLKKSNGKNVPVLESDGEVVAIGFLNLVKYFEKTGHILC